RSGRLARARARRVARRRRADHLGRLDAAESQASMTLPIEGVLDAIRAAAAARRNIVVEASPGAGKTTRVPPAIGEIVERVLVLEPRRLAARLAASRVAAERGLRLGDQVGYQIRFDDRTSKNTRLTYLTEGVLTRRLMRDPELSGVDCVVL